VARPDDELSRTGPRAALRLIRTRNFAPYFAGNAISAMGMWFHNLAAALLIFRLTGSELLLGVLAATQFAPTLVLVSLAGSVADRFDRRRVVIVAQLVAAAFGAVLAALAWVDAAPVVVVLALSLGMGVATAFSAPAAGALIAALVPAADLASAVGLNSMTYNLARAVGPALAALVVTTLGIPEAFAINALSYLALAVGVLVVRPRERARVAGAPTQLRETFALIRGDRRLGGYLLVVMIVGFAADPINTLAPAFAVDFDRPDTDAGLIIGVFGAGAVTAAVLLAGRVPGTRRGIGAMLALLGAGVALFSVTPSLGVALVILFVAGFGYLASNTAATSQLQLEVAEAQRGRIMALWGVAFLGLRPVASLADGALASVFGVRVAGVALALPALVGAVVLLAGPRIARRRAVGARANAS
jgi:MFS family permease